MSDQTVSAEKWDINISSGRGYLDINSREIWNYRDLLMMFVKKDIITVYKQTILGPIWFVVQPILTSFMFLFILDNNSTFLKSINIFLFLFIFNYKILIALGNIRDMGKTKFVATLTTIGMNSFPLSTMTS